MKPDEEDQTAHVGERSAKLGVTVYCVKDVGKKPTAWHLTRGVRGNYQLVANGGASRCGSAVRLRSLSGAETNAQSGSATA